MSTPQEVSILVTSSDPSNFLSPVNYNGSRRNTADSNDMTSRRQSTMLTIAHNHRRPSQIAAQKLMME
jgi:hypothetical protein